MWRNDMHKSSNAFKEIVWPCIADHLGNGALILVEDVTEDTMRKSLDQLAGIDAWHIHNKYGIRGIGSRIQVGKNWRTFTVRYKRDSGAETEYEKRKRAINSEHGWIYPHLTVQAYLETWQGPLFGVCIAKTKDIIEYVSNGCCEFNRTNNSSFAVVSWDGLKQCGCEIIEIEQKNTEAA